MCVFCAAIPFTMAVGASVRNSQHENAKIAEARGEKLPRKLVPAGPATAVVVTSLAIASVFYHTHFIAPL
jgi:hypothetical protein